MPTPISNLKVGDRVRAKSNLGRWIEGPITEIDGHEEQAVRVREDGGSSLWCLNETVELIKPEIKAGDTVRYKGGSWYAAGALLTVQFNDGAGGMSLRCVDDAGRMMWVDEKEVERVANEPATGEPTTMAKALESAERIEDPRADAANDAPKFKTGDRVHHKELALNGTICGPCPGFDGCFIMKPDGESYELHAYQDELELVDEEIKPEVEPEAAPAVGHEAKDKAYRQGETILTIKFVNESDRIFVQVGEEKPANPGDLARCTVLLRRKGGSSNVEAIHGLVLPLVPERAGSSSPNLHRDEHQRQQILLAPRLPQGEFRGLQAHSSRSDAVALWRIQQPRRTAMSEAPHQCKDCVWAVGLTGCKGLYCIVPTPCFLETAADRNRVQPTWGKNCKTFKPQYKPA